jgi:hypothetical protein
MTVAVKAHESGRSHNGRSFPIVRLLLYYGMLVLGGSVLIAFVPGFREALVAPIAAAPASDVDRARRRAENR